MTASKIKITQASKILENAKVPANALNKVYLKIVHLKLGSKYEDLFSELSRAYNDFENRVMKVMLNFSKSLITQYEIVELTFNGATFSYFHDLSETFFAELEKAKKTDNELRVVLKALNKNINEFINTVRKVMYEDYEAISALELMYFNVLAEELVSYANLKASLLIERKEMFKSPRTSEVVNALIESLIACKREVALNCGDGKEQGYLWQNFKVEKFKENVKLLSAGVEALRLSVKRTENDEEIQYVVSTWGIDLSNLISRFEAFSGNIERLQAI